jgi:hypothetical protein
LLPGKIRPLPGNNGKPLSAPTFNEASFCAGERWHCRARTAFAEIKPQSSRCQKTCFSNGGGKVVGGTWPLK